MVRPTGWFKLNDGNVLSGKTHAVVSSQTMIVFTRLLLALAKTSPVGVFVFLFSLPDLPYTNSFWKVWNSFDETYSAENTNKQKTKLRPRDRHIEHVFKSSGSISQNRRGHLDFCAYICVSYVFPRKYFFLV